MAVLVSAFAPFLHLQKHPGKAAVVHRIPKLWVADAVCETGSNPPRWHWRNGVYEGGIMFYYGTWDAWKVHVRRAARYDHADQAPAWVQAAVAAWGLANVGRWGCLYHSDVWAQR